MTTIALEHSRGASRTPEHAQRAENAGRPRVRTRLTRRGRAVLTGMIVLPLLVGGAALLATGGAFAGDEGARVSFQHVTVHQGDSLWNIAQRIAPHADPRDVVAALVDLNGLPSSAVQAGERLAVPPQFDGSGH